MDLSRCMNKVVKASKFKIELTLAVLQVEEKEEYMFLFDLKSAYLQIRVNENFIKYLGFAIEEEDRRKRYFQYLNFPFGLNDAMRVLTKMIKLPLERWRQEGIKVFIHVDDGLGMVKGNEKVLEASRKVREELGRYLWLASEEKLAWGARQSLTWTGFL